ncbi:hypothetical protein LMG28690_04306 [Paraburkholderia caffeinilytica]|nr:hypothetical protein LMG28690_04306 [Paraburkholderia caffeinilytica]
MSLPARIEDSRKGPFALAYFNFPGKYPYF